MPVLLWAHTRWQAESRSQPGERTLSVPHCQKRRTSLPCPAVPDAPPFLELVRRVERGDRTSRQCSQSSASRPPWFDVSGAGGCGHLASVNQERIPFDFVAVLKQAAFRRSCSARAVGIIDAAM